MTGDFLSHSLDDFASQMNVNFLGHVSTVRAFLPQLLARVGRSGVTPTAFWTISLDCNHFVFVVGFAYFLYNSLTFFNCIIHTPYHIGTYLPKPDSTKTHKWCKVTVVHELLVFSQFQSFPTHFSLQGTKTANTSGHVEWCRS